MSERQLGKYKLLEEVGQGGMAVVYRGIDTSLNREVAIKILHSYLAEQEESCERFQREAQAVARLRHENILEIFDYSGDSSSESYIVTEFIHGQTLKSFMARHPIAHPEIAVMIIVEVCNALAHAHGLGIIHRDIKPENIMIRDDGRIKLTDFGIAQMVDVQRLTITGQLLGSPAYMAPELVEGKIVDFRSDIFSVGTLLYQLTTSELPFKGKNPHEVLRRITDGYYVDPQMVNPVVDSQLARIIRRALARNPEQRYADIMLLKEDLLAYLADVRISNPRVELTHFFSSPVSYSQQLQTAATRSLLAKAQSALAERKTPLALEYLNRLLCIHPSCEEALTLLNQIARKKRTGLVAATIGIFLALLMGGYLLISIPHNSGSLAKTPFADAGLSIQTGPKSKPANLTFDSSLLRHNSPDSSRLLSNQSSMEMNIDMKRPPAPIIKVNPTIMMRQIEIIPTPKAVTIWLNGKKLGDYGPDLQFVQIPRNSTSKLHFRNDACCFERIVSLAPGQTNKSIRVKLPWKPARVKVQVKPKIAADILVGSLVTSPGQLVEIPIPSYSDSGSTETEIKVSAAGFYTEAQKVVLKANQTITVPVSLHKLSEP